MDLIKRARMASRGKRDKLNKTHAVSTHIYTAHSRPGHVENAPARLEHRDGLHFPFVQGVHVCAGIIAAAPEAS